MLAALTVLLAAQGLADAPAPQPAEPPRRGLEQIFIAPSGEAFRAPADAPYPVAAWFARADADHDGKLSQGEYDADFLSYFARLDLNRDGTIDARELSAYEEEMAAELQTGTYTGYGPSGSDQGEDVRLGDSNIRVSTRKSSGIDAARGAGRFDLLRIPQPVAAMDTGLNGRISRQEAQEAADYRYAFLDPKGRGYLLLAELPETYAQTSRINGERRGKRSKR